MINDHRKIKPIEPSLYWLLEAVRYDQMPVGRLLPYGDWTREDHFFAGYNRGDPGFDEDALILALTTLQDWGWIGFYVWDREHPFSPSALPFVEKERISEAVTLERGREVYRVKEDALIYGLTQLGGEQWEQRSQADWNRYVSTESMDATDEEGALQLWNFFDGQGEDPSESEEERKLERRFVRITGINEEKVKEKAKIETETFDVVAPSSIKVEEISPWRATYWKTFPSATRISYSLLSESGLEAKGGTITSYSELDQNRLFCDAPWYTDPFTGKITG